MSTDDYMPMPIQSPEEFNKVLNVSWYRPEKPLEEQAYVYNQETLFYLLRAILTNVYSFPCVLPFSQMYPLCCIDIRNFLNQFYFFANDDFSRPNTIDETVKEVSCSLLLVKIMWLVKSWLVRLWMSFCLAKSAIPLSNALPPSTWVRLFRY